MGIVISKKELSTDNINCGDSFKILLSLSAAPDILSSPKDIALLLDRSGSMGNEPLAELKKGVCDFIDIIDKETDTLGDGHIGNGSKIGIVSFSTTATIDQPLTTSVNDLKGHINSITSGGSTNHEDAFIKGINLLDNPSSNEKIIIMFTDGESNKGMEGFQIAQAAKDKGIKIYSLGYGDLKRLNADALHKWASTPSSAFTLITPNYLDIQKMFVDLLNNVDKKGATNIEITDTVSDCFKITSFEPVLKGDAEIISDNKIVWKIPELGTVATDGAILTFNVQHTGSCVGNVEVNSDIQYKDDQNNTVVFPSPILNIACDTPVVIEECPITHDISVSGCADYVDFNAEDIQMNSLGRVLQLSVTLNNVCPNKRVALAAIVTETDASGNEYSRGMKTLVIPAHPGPDCKDVLVRCIKFVLPEEIDETGSPTSLCNNRTFKARFIANYIDNDFYCCEN